MAIVNGIGAILTGIINGIVAFFDIIISCLTCGRGGGGKAFAAYYESCLARRSTQAGERVPGHAREMTERRRSEGESDDDDDTPFCKVRACTLSYLNDA